MKFAVILSTYNAPGRLQPTLAGYAAQTVQDFELIVADDGSTDATRDVIEAHSAGFNQPIKHVWHDDLGFRKCRILNQAMLATHADYLIFSDGDCIPRRDFVAQHARLARPGRFLSGGYLKLNERVSQRIRIDEVASGDALDARWLVAAGMQRTWKLQRLAMKPWQARCMDLITPTRASWNGHNASGWRRDLLRVNGFDERMQYWAQDREFGERLEHAGIKGLQIRYSAVCVHLHHDRPYKNEDSRVRNQSIRRATRAGRLTWTAHGIVKRDHVDDTPLRVTPDLDVLVQHFGV